MFFSLQDLVEELSREKTWWTPNKLSQQAYDRKEDGSFAGFEEEVCLQQPCRPLHSPP